MVTVQSAGMLLIAYRTPATLSCLVLFVVSAFFFFRVAVKIPKPFDVAALKRKAVVSAGGNGRNIRASLSPVFWQVLIASTVVCMAQVREITASFYPQARVFLEEAASWRTSASMVFPMAMANTVLFAHSGSTSSMVGFATVATAAFSAFATVQAGEIPTPGAAVHEIPGQEIFVALGKVIPSISYLVVFVVAAIRMASAGSVGNKTPKEIETMRECAGRLVGGVSFVLLNNFMMETTVEACNSFIAPHLSTIIGLILGETPVAWSGGFFTAGMLKAFGLATVLLLWGDSIIELARVSQGFHIITGKPLSQAQDDDHKVVAPKKAVVKTKKKKTRK